MATNQAAPRGDLTPTHVTGTILSSPPPYTTVATFPKGSLLENLAVRHDGTLLVSDMLSGCIWFIDPNESASQDSIELVHKFETAVSEQPQQGQHSPETEKDGHGSYSSTPAAEAIVASPIVQDVFYIPSGLHGKEGTWAIYELDMRSFVPRQGRVSQPPTTTVGATSRRATISKLAPVPSAAWLNGATVVGTDANSLVLMADSIQGVLYSFNVKTKEVSIWLEHPLLGKITTRPPWPGVNGLQANGSYVYFTCSDRAILGRIEVGMPENGRLPVPGRVEVLATGCCGDDLCLDAQGNIYVATNPMNTVQRYSNFGLPKPDDSNKSLYDDRYEQQTPNHGGEPERAVILGYETGSQESSKDPAFDPVTVGPTAVALANPQRGLGDLYVTTCGGIIAPLDGEVREAKVLSVKLAT
jgi:hypothetical protein